jgi:hypothetical protein
VVSAFGDKRAKGGTQTMHFRTVVSAVVLCGCGFAVGLADRAEAARVCGGRKITATGAPSNLTFFSRSRAKTAWITKVGRDPRLGPAYAQWLKSQDRRVVCRKVDTQSICIAAALPCRTVGPISTGPNPAATPVTPSAALRPL